jgi:acetyltransferase EpsM
VPESLIIVGGGQHAQVVVEAAHSRPECWRVEGFVDVNSAAQMPNDRTVNNLGSDNYLKQRAAREDCWAVLGIGSVRSSLLRRQLIETYKGYRVRWAVVVHARAYVSPSATANSGTVILAGAVVNSGASLGAHSIVNSAVVIEHGVQIGDFSVISPACAIGGGTIVGADSFVGIGATIRDHLRIGCQATVGMGAVVVRDVAPGTTVIGIPAHEIS